MPRYPRAFVVGYPHHVVQRGHNRRSVFAAEQDYRAYLSNLVEQLEVRKIGLYAYCLMTNHVHLLLEPRPSGKRYFRTLMRCAGPDAIDGI